MLQTDTAQYIPFCAPDSTLEVVHADTAVFSLDSILSTLSRPEVVEVESLFKGHSLQVKDSEPQPHESGLTPPWVFGVLVVLTVCLLVYFKTHGLTVSNVLASTFNHRTMDRTLRENNLNHMSVLAPISIMWGAVVALIACYLADGVEPRFLPDMSSWQFMVIYLALTLSLTAVYHFRNTLFRLIGYTFDEGDAAISYITSSYFFVLLETTFAVPLVMVLYYGKSLGLVPLIAVAILFVIMFALRFLRGIKLFLTQSKSAYLHLFYYLCIVEFVPIMVLLKVINIL